MGISSFIFPEDSTFCWYYFRGWLPVESLADTDTLDIPIDQTPGITFTKNVAESDYDQIGDVLHYTLTAQNTGNVTLTNVTISDGNLTTLNCSPTQPATLTPNQTLECTGNYTIQQSDLNSGSVENEASVSANPPAGDPITETDDVTINANQSAILGVAKRLVGSPTEVSGQVGVWQVRYEVLVRNYGNVTLSNVQVTDNLEDTYTTPSGFPISTLYTVQSITSSTLSTNSGFNGRTDINLLLGGDSLNPGEEGRIILTVYVTPSYTGPFENSATGSSTEPDGDPVDDISQNGTNPDPDGDGDPGNNSAVTLLTFGSSIIDPPSGVKSFDSNGFPVIQWTAVWINDSNVLSVSARVTDEIPAGSTFADTGIPSGYDLPLDALPGSVNTGVTCLDSSIITTTEYCYYEAPSGTYPRGRIIWQGILGPNQGGSDTNEIAITYSLRANEGTNSINNVAYISVDSNADGDFVDLGEVNVAQASERWSINDPTNSARKLPSTGFPQGHDTKLKHQLDMQEYTQFASLTLQIPSLGIDSPIVGVPFYENEWDVSWLGNSVGWLNGTKFPTLMGNSVLTGHIWNANNQPGIFINLHKLAYGDLIKVQAFGSVYTYEVRENRLISPSNTNSVFTYETKSWVTLLTCEGYQANSESYLYRRIVRAVLISIE